jgi:hypothetical protein
LTISERKKSLKKRAFRYQTTIGAAGLPEVEIVSVEDAV